jgi:1-acyl-sn-glycerol-3-phosphate acyltransferase
MHTKKELVNKFVDVEQLILSKNPKLLRRMPRFILNYLKNKIHEKEINDFMHLNKDVYGVDFCDAVIQEFAISVEIKGQENIPLEGGAIFVANHPLGGVDALAIVSGLRGIRDDIKFIVNDLLLHLKNLNGLFVGVNKHGRNAAESLRKVDELFATDQAIFIFPAGLVSRRKNGKIRDLPWKKTFVTRSKRYQKPVVPVYVEGKLSHFFYLLSTWRKRLGIKANIEMLFLSDETFKQKNKKITIVFGKPLMPDFFHEGKSDQEWADEVKEMVYKIPHLPKHQ